MQYQLFDVVSCMGVTSTIVDESEFAKLVVCLKSYLNDNGILILKDSLSKISDQILCDEKTGYIALYREYRRYMDIFAKTGFRFIDEIRLVDSETKFNSIFILVNSSEVNMNYSVTR